MMKYIRIDYTVKPEVDLDNLKAAITEFVAGIHTHHPGHQYTSFQHPANSNRFIHIGEFVDEVLPDLQKQAFFRQFTEYLPGQCSAGPEVTRLDRVASTAAHTTVARLINEESRSQSRCSFWSTDPTTSWVPRYGTGLGIRFTSEKKYKLVAANSTVCQS